jgi:hypothetical protein
MHKDASQGARPEARRHCGAKDVLPEEHVRLLRMLLGMIEIDDAPTTEHERLRRMLRGMIGGRTT